MVCVMAVVDKIKFKMLSPQMIKKMSAVEIITPEVYDADAYPIEGGVMDTRMGVIDPGMRCKTCGGKSGECQVHFGHIEIAKPVYTIIYIKLIVQSDSDELLSFFAVNKSRYNAIVNISIRECDFVRFFFSKDSM